MSIARYEQNGAEVAPIAPPQVSAVAALTEWAHGAQAAYQVAENLVNTSFCPQHYRGKPHEATAAILAGLEVGLQPMASLQAFNPIQGNAAPKAITLRAIVLSKGHSLDLVESSSTRAVVVGRRNGTGTPQRSEWTIERAQLAGLPKKNPNWNTQPEAMLIARATSEGARLTAADAILGIPYSYEELQDGMTPPVQASAEQVAPPAPVGKPRRNVASVLPPVESAPVSQPIDPNGRELKQLRELTAERVSTDFGVVMAWVSDNVGHKVGSPKDLTLAEAKDLIERLEKLSGGNVWDETKESA